MLLHAHVPTCAKLFKSDKLHMQIKLLSTCFYHLKVHSQVWENFGNWNSFKNDEKCFSFHLKSSFHSQDIYIFVMTFWPCRKNDLFVLPNISQSKGNQTMNFGQLMEYKKIIIFLQKLSRKWGRETSTRPLYILEKAL